MTLVPRGLRANGPAGVLPAIAVGIASLGLYCATLAPGLTWAHDSGDGGELAAAAWTGGVAHPPGYPTYLVIAHAFTRLPIGEVATRTNLLSAFCAATTSLLLTWIVMTRTGRWPVAMGTGLALSTSPLLWSQATVTEVHTLNGLFAALLLVLLSRTHRDIRRARQKAGHARQAWLSVAIGWVWGLSLGNHPTALCCAPLVVLALWRLGRAGWLGAAGFSLGLTVYLYLPIRAATGPAINWGDPRTLDRFWWTVSGALYRPFLFSLPLAHLPARLLAWANLVSRQFGWIGVMVLALGAAALWDADRAFLWATGATVALCSAFAIGYDTTDSYLYLVPALVCLVPWLGMGGAWLLGTLEGLAHRSTQVTLVGSLLAVALPLWAAIHRFPAQDLSDDRTVLRFGAAVLGSAPAGALVLSQEDAYTFALWYMQYALGQRPDVTVIDLELLGFEWYTRSLSQQLQGATELFLARDRNLMDVAAHLHRPVCAIVAPGPKLACSNPEEMR